LGFLVLPHRPTQYSNPSLARCSPLPSHLCPATQHCQHPSLPSISFNIIISIIVGTKGKDRCSPDSAKLPINHLAGIPCAGLPDSLKVCGLWVPESVPHYLLPNGSPARPCPPKFDDHRPATIRPRPYHDNDSCEGDQNLAHQDDDTYLTQSIPSGSPRSRWVGPNQTSTVSPSLIAVDSLLMIQTVLLARPLQRS